MIIDMNKVKKIARLTLVCVLVAAMALLSACKKQQNNVVVDGTTADGAPSIIGSWIAPDPINAEYDELWVFEPDAQTYHLYQVDKDYKVNKSIDGTYKLGENNILEVTMMGYTLTYTYALSDANTLVLSDHGTDATYVRYTGEIKR